MQATALSSTRISALERALPGGGELLQRLLTLCIRGLPRMYDPAAKQFAFTRKRFGDRLELRGVSLRYAAITLLGAQFLPEREQRAVLSGETAAEMTARLASDLDGIRNLGDAALLLWAAAELHLAQVAPLLTHVRKLLKTDPQGFVVENAWVLSALVAAAPQIEVGDLLPGARQRLLATFPGSAGVFPHWLAGRNAPRLRRHVGCFADQVYPIQALAREYVLNRTQQSLDAAARCGAQICKLQGAHGQWWWHYDARRGTVVEGYPVYTVHQDSMAPMALLDLSQAGGPDHMAAVALGLRWMTQHPERNVELIDDELGLIWRSIRRADPAKSVRKVRAAATAVAPGLRLGFLDSVYPPGRVDYEDRPYHLGWILQAWLRPATQGAGQAVAQAVGAVR